MPETRLQLLARAIEAYVPRAVALRRDLHAHPELGLECARTARVTKDELASLGCEILAEGLGKTGLVALVRGNRPGKGKIVAFRADMDALPLTEATGVDYASQVPGMMHACGHDGHVAIALAVASALRCFKDFPGAAAIVIQPGEEGFAGAREMIQDGLFKICPASEIYAVHGAADVPFGRFATKPGPMTAAGDLFRIAVKGKGGHGGRPQAAVDPVVAAGQLIVALQSVVSRNTDPTHAAVISIGSIHAGSEDGVSVIPAQVRLAGTTRTFTEEDRTFVETRMREMCEAIGRATRTEIALDYVRMYPAVVNNPEQTAALEAAVTELYGDEAMVPAAPAMGSEDFSFMLEKVPGCYVRVGTGDENHTAMQHHPAFDFNDRAIAPAAGLMAELVLRRLEALNG